MRIGLKVIIILFILGLGGYIYFHQFHSHQQTNNFDYSVIAFDFDGRHSTVTSESLFNGDALIFLKVLPHDNTIDFVESLDQLQTHDNEQKGYIALDSPDFVHFYFGRYLKDQNIIEFRRLPNSGIAGISIKYFEKDIQSAQVILLDNSRRNLLEVPVDSAIFKNIKLKECDTECDLP